MKLTVRPEKSNTKRIQKETSIPTIHFQVLLMLVSERVPSCWCLSCFYSIYYALHLIDVSLNVFKIISWNYQLKLYRIDIFIWMCILYLHSLSGRHNNSIRSDITPIPEALCLQVQSIVVTKDTVMIWKRNTLGTWNSRTGFFRVLRVGRKSTHGASSKWPELIPQITGHENRPWKGHG